MADETGRMPPIDERAFAKYADTLLASLGRAEQRGWARTYLRGLLDTDGRKSISRILGDSAADATRQALQQFLNQSPWDPGPVRQAQAALFAREFGPLAWMTDEVPFVKHGRHSVGVDRQYVRSLGRVANCQLALAFSLVARDAVLPVSWRLLLPPSWDADGERRARAGVPAPERHRPTWHHEIDELDDIVEDWPVPPLPLLTPAPDGEEADHLVGALEERRLSYILEISGRLPVAVDRSSRPVRVVGGPPADGARTMPLEDLVQLVRERSRKAVSWREPDGRLARAQFVTLQVRPARRAPGRPPIRPSQLLVAKLPFTGRIPPHYWLTNLVDHKLFNLIELFSLRYSGRQGIEEMGRSVGLFDFEGRSFRGWHHHVTLASAAYGYHLLARRAART